MVVVPPSPIGELELLVLPWAKEFHPEKYQATIAMKAKDIARYRKFLLRLVEVRWEESKEWRREVPLSVLERTSLTQKIKVKGSDIVIEVKGRGAPGERQFTWEMLGWPVDEFRAAIEVIQSLDLEIYEPERKQQ